MTGLVDEKTGAIGMSLKQFHATLYKGTVKQDTVETYMAEDFDGAMSNVLYTRGLKEKGWAIGKSGITVTKGDLTWVVTPLSCPMGFSDKIGVLAIEHNLQSAAPVVPVKAVAKKRSPKLAPTKKPAKRRVKAS